MAKMRTEKYEHLFSISIIINLCAIFLQITFSYAIVFAT